MNPNDQPPPIPDPQPAAPPAPRSMSLSARLLNIFAIPGDVFEDVRTARTSTVNWLVPLLIAAAVGVISIIIIYSQPAIVQQIREQQGAMYDNLVKAGKMTQVQADRALTMLGSTFLKIGGAFGAVIISGVQLFGWAFVLWLLARWFLKVEIDYGRAMEVSGLAMMIIALGGIVTLLLSVTLGKLTLPTLALLLRQFDGQNPLHLALAAANIFTIWFIFVMASGLARLTGVRFSRALSGVLGCWLGIQMLQLLLLAGFMGASKVH